MNIYTNEKNALILIALLKKSGIRNVVASPGNTNTAFVGSIQNDDFFTVYSVVDERSAAYFAVGLAAELSEPVVISCTGATASRNYLPGLTEAFYRKLPVLAVTSSQRLSRGGHLHAQFIDRTDVPRDAVKQSIVLPIVKDNDDFWDCEIKVNRAILSLKSRGGGPVHINMPTTFEKPFATSELPPVRLIKQFQIGDQLPSIEGKKVAVFLGSHRRFTKEETRLIEDFCACNNGVVFTDHTSGYRGRGAVNFALVAGQENFNVGQFRPDILIHMGEVTGDYFSLNLVGGEVWRVSEDGELRDTFKKLSSLFAMSELDFFRSFTNPGYKLNETYYLECIAVLDRLRACVGDLPFSNLWVAQYMSNKIPRSSHIHFGILNSLRCWNFFCLPGGVTSSANVGGFGIDGPLSTFVGEAVLSRCDHYYCVLGDLAFFYDINVLGNRHIPDNLRILLINNGEGVEFRQHNHHASMFGESTSKYISAAGHNGNKSRELVKSFVEGLGFSYLSASTKNEFKENLLSFVSTERQERPIVFEVFTVVDEECDALRVILDLEGDNKIKAKKALKSMAKKIVKRL